MKRKTAAIIAVITVLVFAVLVVESINLSPPFSSFHTHTPSIPAVQISYPVISTGGYVNSSVEFIVTVNTFIDSSAVNSISYSLDGGEQVNLTDLAVTTYDDYGPTKVDYKAYKATISLKDLSEGNHTLDASANGMSDSRSFVVNSNYHITALNVLSPSSPVYTFNEVPLKFTYTGDITNAHYYLYRGNELVTDSSLSGDTTLSNLPDGSYNLLVFVTTQYGQDSKMIDFLVISPSTIAIVSAIVILLISIGVLVYFKKYRSKKLT
ncbi:hypothetical protein GX563_08625 [Candidatus Bathyarchaeota archaeon]|nr:hypothetical protein [Candidatus Bathyarchaeota archaeon]